MLNGDIKALREWKSRDAILVIVGTNELCSKQGFWLIVFTELLVADTCSGFSQVLMARSCTWNAFSLGKRLIILELRYVWSRVLPFWEFEQICKE